MCLRLAANLDLACFFNSFAFFVFSDILFREHIRQKFSHFSQSVKTGYLKCCSVQMLIKKNRY